MMKGPNSKVLIMTLAAPLVLAGCGGKTAEAFLEPVPGAEVTRVAKYRFEWFRTAPEDRPYVKVGEVTAKTTDIEKAKELFKKHAKKVKGQAAVNIRAVKVGNYRGLSVHNWVADIVIWQ
tara:strand:- start:1720 stop:2079 length:360 start_codon:yes stop_codon:yes gene_type:complete